MPQTLSKVVLWQTNNIGLESLLDLFQWSNSCTFWWYQLNTKCTGFDWTFWQCGSTGPSYFEFNFRQLKYCQKIWAKLYFDKQTKKCIGIDWTFWQCGSTGPFLPRPLMTLRHSQLCTYQSEIWKVFMINNTMAKFNIGRIWVRVFKVCFNWRKFSDKILAIDAFRPPIKSSRGKNPIPTKGKNWWLSSSNIYGIHFSGKWNW